MLAAAAVLVLVLVPVAAGSASAQAAPTPSPTLGSTNSPPPNPPGSANSSPQDYNGAVWAVAAAVIVAVVVVGGTLFLNRTRRIDLRQDSTIEEDNRINEIQQRGVRSPLARAGRVSPLEAASHAFRNRLLDRLGL